MRELINEWHSLRKPGVYSRRGLRVGACQFSLTGSWAQLKEVVLRRVGVVRLGWSMSAMGGRQSRGAVTLQPEEGRGGAIENLSLLLCRAAAGDRGRQRGQVYNGAQMALLEF